MPELSALEDFVPQTHSYCVLSSHSDDAALSVAGTLKFLTATGKDLALITCFSKSAFSGMDASSGVESVTRIRKAEDRAFARLLSDDCAAIWIDLPDAPLRGVDLGDLFTSRDLGETDRALASVLANSLASVLDPSSTLLVPLAIGSHIDHLIVRCAGFLLFERGFSELVFYEDLPYAAPYQLKTLNAVVARIANQSCVSLSPRSVAYPGLAEFKKRALKCYDSQISDGWVEDALLHARKFQGPHLETERVWQVSRATL